MIGVTNGGYSTCPVCRNPFVPRRSDAITCSSKCRQKAYRDRAVTDNADPLKPAGPLKAKQPKPVVRWSKVRVLWEHFPNRVTYEWVDEHGSLIEEEHP